MKRVTKIFGTLMILIFSLTIQVPTAQTSTPKAQDATLNFIKDVLQLDTSKYDVTLTLYDQSAGVSNIVEEHVKFDLENNGAKGGIACLFRNNRLALCMIDAPPNASLIYKQASDDVLTSARGIMERYQSFIRDSSLTEMVDVLKTIDKVGDVTKIVGNVKLELTSSPHMTMFYFKHTYNDVDYNEIQFSFDDFGFTFAEYFSRYKMGSTDVRISKQQAIDSAIKYVKNYSYEAIGGPEGNETKVTISGFKVNKERTTVQILPGERENLLYPCWKVEVALDNLYPGNVYAFSVEIWADNGEILDCTPLAVGAGFPTDNPQNRNSATPPSDSATNGSSVSTDKNNNASMDLIMVAIAATIAILIPSITATAILRKKRSK